MKRNGDGNDMAAVGYGNFAFVFDLDRELYQNLVSAEKNARINFRNSGKFLRDALEKFIGTAIREKGLGDAVSPDLKLGQRIWLLRNERAMRDAGYLKGGQSLQDCPILPNVEKVSFIQQDGAKGERYLYDYIRMLANACSHVSEEVNAENPQVSFENVVQALKGFHKVLLRYYGKRISERVNPFSADTMPIGEFAVEKSYVPSDSLRSQCQREFLGYTLDDDGEPGFHALIRLYNRKDLGDAFMLRNHKCFLEACKLCMSGIPEGMTRLRELTPAHSDASDFYMICYIFNQKAYPLNEETLTRMNLKQRLEICARLARCIDDLHHSDVPIYHRMLSYESVYISQFRNKWIPYVVKFDYAKIDSTRPVETVYVSAKTARDVLIRQSREKYLAPEWNDIETNQTGADWAKVDVYSLGVLMGDILKGSFAGGVVDGDDLEELEDAGVPELILDALENMLIQSPKQRCTMDQVREIFDMEIR